MKKPERREFRLALHDADRGVSVERPLVLSRHPSESEEHVVLRVLAYCLLYEERLSFGPDVCVGDAPDLVAHDLTGKVSAWVRVGDIAPRFCRKVVQHNRDADVHVLFATPARQQAFLDELARLDERPPRGWDRLRLWTIDERLVAALAATHDLRQRWTVTVVGGQLYADVNGAVHEAAVTCASAP